MTLKIIFLIYFQFVIFSSTINKIFVLKNIKLSLYQNKPTEIDLTLLIFLSAIILLKEIILFLNNKIT